MDIERNKLMALKINGNCVVVAVVDKTLSLGVIQRFHLQTATHFPLKKAWTILQIN